MQRFEKELADRAVVTWTFSEPTVGIQAFSWTPTVNRVQAVLRKDGVIELSYNDVSARDAVVGVFPTVMAGVEKRIATVTATDETMNGAAHLDVKKVTFTAIDGLFLKATIETRGPVLPDGDPGINGVMYRIVFDKSVEETPTRRQAAVVWTIRGSGEWAWP